MSNVAVTTSEPKVAEAPQEAEKKEAAESAEGTKNVAIAETSQAKAEGKVDLAKVAAVTLDAAPPKMSVFARASIDTSTDEDVNQEKLEAIRDVFQIFDRDGDGTISTKELGVVMKALGQNPTEAELLDIIAEADKDSNGLIDFEEFSAVMIGIMKECDNEEDLKGAFRVFDRDGKGYISVDDLRETIASLGERYADEEYEEMINAADLDGDGQVTLTDFIELMIPPKRY